jgi:hypothetical protein
VYRCDPVEMKSVGSAIPSVLYPRICCGCKRHTQQQECCLSNELAARIVCPALRRKRAGSVDMFKGKLIRSSMSRLHATTWYCPTRCPTRRVSYPDTLCSRVSFVRMSYRLAGVSPEGPTFRRVFHPDTPRVLCTHTKCRRPWSLMIGRREK